MSISGCVQTIIKQAYIDNWTLRAYLHGATSSGQYAPQPLATADAHDSHRLSTARVWFSTAFYGDERGLRNVVASFVEKEKA